MGDEPNRATVSAALNGAIDSFMGHDYSEAQYEELFTLVTSFDELTRRGVERGPSNRRDRFIGQMVQVIDEASVAEPRGFVPFLESPYSGTENPLAPSVNVHRREDEVVAVVHLGLALEGAPGRGHGGAVAAIFDDIMGAVQRITGRPAYTKSLTVEYLAPFPADRDVTITAREVDCNERTYTIEADAVADGRNVARSTAVFTRIEAIRFGSSSGK